jgi:hypothetical protein
LLRSEAAEELLDAGRGRGALLEIRRIGIVPADEQAEVSAVLVGRLVEAQVGASAGEQVVEERDRDPDLGRELLPRRLPGELREESTPRRLDAREDLRVGTGHRDHARVLVDPTVHALADPPIRVGREPIPAGRVELLDGSDHPEVRGLDEVVLIPEADESTAVFRDVRDGQAEVRGDELLASLRAAPSHLWRSRLRAVRMAEPGLDPTAELDLLRRRQERHSADLIEPPSDPGPIHGSSLSGGRSAVASRRSPSPRPWISSAVESSIGGRSLSSSTEPLTAATNRYPIAAKAARLWLSESPSFSRT